MPPQTIDTVIIIKAIIIFLVSGAACIGLIWPVSKLAWRIGAIDRPVNARKVNQTPKPCNGGLAIFGGFLLAVVLFCNLTDQMGYILIGAAIIVLMGALDDIFDLNPWLRLCIQLAVACLPVIKGGLTIDHFSNIFHIFGRSDYFSLGVFSAPLTVLWIAFMCNAVNWIDGLDGLTAGVSAISALCMFLIAIQIGDPITSLVIAALAGACIGFLPMNFNPSKIIMGDSGAMFLGYMLATLSIQGMFKYYAVVSFAVPFLILGLPVFDALFLIVRRTLHGKNPLGADRGHIHHRLYDMGLTQKQSVAILYGVSAVLGLIAVVLNVSGKVRAIALLFVILISILMAVRLFIDRQRKAVAGKSGKPDETGGNNNGGQGEK